MKESIKYEIKEYDEFPFKKDNDEVIREFPDLQTAQFESMYLNDRARMGERYYVIDNPHEWIKPTERQKIEVELYKKKAELKREEVKEKRSLGFKVRLSLKGYDFEK